MNDWLTKQMYEKKTTLYRKPQSIGGSNNLRNISYLSEDVLKAWNLLFHDLTAQQIAHKINVQFVDPDFVLVAERRNP